MVEHSDMGALYASQNRMQLEEVDVRKAGSVCVEERSNEHNRSTSCIEVPRFGGGSPLLRPAGSKLALEAQKKSDDEPVSRLSSGSKHSD